MLKLEIQVLLLMTRNKNACQEIKEGVQNIKPKGTRTGRESLLGINGAKQRHPQLSKRVLSAMKRLEKLFQVKYQRCIGKGSWKLPQGYRLLDISILQDILGVLLCPECKKQELYVVEDVSKKKGMANVLAVKYIYCSCCLEKYTSKTVINSELKDGQTFDINICSVYTMSRCGLCHKQICGFMNMPLPMARINFDKLSNKLCDAAEKVAKSSMIEGAMCLKQTEGVDIGVSVDGTWQKRDFSSMNGVVAVISVSTGNVIDCEIMSKTCKSCTTLSPLQQTNVEEYGKWRLKDEGDCNLNYKGSSPNMESSGVFSIFTLSIEERGLRYSSYYGDGDNKSNFK